MYRIDSQNLNFAIPINMLYDLPERSRAALAKAAEKAAAEKAATAATPNTSVKAEEKVVLGAELHDHFNFPRRVSATGVANTHNGKLNITFVTKPDGGLSISRNDSGNQGGGIWGIKDESQVCFNISSTHFRVLRGCYRLYTSEPKKFVLRSVEDGTFIQYTDG